MVTVKELKEELKELGLRRTGPKKDLINRLEEYKKKKVINTLEEYRKEQNKKYDIWELCRRGNISGVKYLVDSEGLKGNFGINRLSPHDRSPLHMAALCGRSNIVSYLIKNGAYDYNGNAYLSGTVEARNLMCQYGFKGLMFSKLPDVKLLNAKRRLCLSNIDIEYDLILVIQKQIERIFTDKLSNHKVLHRFKNGFI